MRIKTFNDFINERAVSIDDVLENEPYSGVALKHSVIGGGHDKIKMVLYDFKKKVIEGYIALEKFPSDKEYMITRAYAIDKHGPLMYELALSSVSPTGIIPDRIIRPAAQKIWSFFDKNRNDVKKTVIGPKHYWYAKEYDIDIEHEYLKDPEVLKLLNKAYSVDKPLKHTDELFQRGEELIKKYNLNVVEVIEKAEKEFLKKYDSEMAA